ncbi:hypothetical protein RM545_00155 [Zunongwangia sp. F260]|uniref:Photosystem II subunit H n=1 Tax=Autumnicola lenta TaxID=3075593 RepID=A0ABU3CFP9_9FLAO|nr:hypothetical protein [Zunongwangia sp. F260]MDT0645088.1 hypothetical protein [Zunongwangia sp. F260]
MAIFDLQKLETSESPSIIPEVTDLPGSKNLAGRSAQKLTIIDP